jgi:hypothetical protein
MFILMTLDVFVCILFYVHALLTGRRGPSVFGKPTKRHPIDSRIVLSTSYKSRRPRAGRRTPERSRLQHPYADRATNSSSCNDCSNSTTADSVRPPPALPSLPISLRHSPPMHRRSNYQRLACFPLAASSEFLPTHPLPHSLWFGNRPL